MTKNVPTVGKFIDDEEEELYNIIESEDYVPGPNLLTLETLQALQMAARNTINEERTKISIRLPKTDLLRLKAKAMREGMPYQTLIGSILHKAVSS
jgi:predicted DNA binding CopG/RHH family protein